MSTSKSISVVFVDSGVRLTEALFMESALAAYNLECAKLDANQGEIADAVKVIFDDKPGVRVNRDYIKTMVMSKIGSTPETHAFLVSRIDAYLKENIGEQGDGKLFASQKGRNGGVWRQADFKDPKAAESK